MDGQEEDKDEDMLFESDWTHEVPQDSTEDGPQRDRRKTSVDVMSRIEAVFETVADALLNERSDLSIALAAQSHSSALGEDIAPPKAGRTRNSVFTFPGRSTDEAWRFCRYHYHDEHAPAIDGRHPAVVLRLLELIHECICGGVILTKRDIYYRDPALFGKQSTVDRYIDHIATAFEVPRSLLNVTAAAKGLMAGAAVVHKRDGSKIDFVGIQKSGILVPRMDEVLSVDLSRARWILVVEKEATFQSVLSSASWEEIQWHAIVVTGKGYPDVATRAMTRFLSEATPRNGFAEPPVYGLMDYDPDGLAILQTYRHGSSKLSNENDSLVVPGMQWLGLRSRNITDEDSTHRNQGLLPLTPRNRRKAINMLDNERSFEQEEAIERRRELQVMLMLNVKAEIQIVDSDPSGLDTLIMKGVTNA